MKLTQIFSYNHPFRRQCSRLRRKFRYAMGDAGSIFQRPSDLVHDRERDLRRIADSCLSAVYLARTAKEATDLFNETFAICSSEKRYGYMEAISKVETLNFLTFFLEQDRDYLLKGHDSKFRKHVLDTFEKFLPIGLEDCDHTALHLKAI